jgi:ABC-2 type transport system ATP-binding protein
MRQRVRLAQALAHDPQVLVLDEPLNGLDPVVRAETISLFRQLAASGRHVVISSHVLQEVDVISDRVVLMANGMIVAEGDIRGVRDEIHEHPSQFLIRCPHPARLASLLFERAPVVEARVMEEDGALLVLTRDRSVFTRTLTRLASEGLGIESVVPADENVHALYEYLVGGSA